MRATYLIVMMIAVASMLCGCKNVVAGTKTRNVEQTVDKEDVMGYSTGKVNQGSWMELFMGMGQVQDEQDKDGYTYNYECRVPELEGIDGILSQELEATWYREGDGKPDRYRCMLGLYVDEDFPSDPVFRQVELGIDTLLTQSFDYNDELEAMKKSLALRKGYNPKSSQDIMNRAKQIFNQFTKKNHELKSDVTGNELLEARVCIVAHKIYDKGDWASYIIEFSFDYNGSCGCPSWADYITVNKKTGHRLTSGDLVEKYGLAQVSDNLREAYVKAKGERNVELDVYNLTGHELIDGADGCAIVSDGVMFYYRPYSVGCGAEGMYNLILDFPWP